LAQQEPLTAFQSVHPKPPIQSGSNTTEVQIFSAPIPKAFGWAGFINLVEIIHQRGELQAPIAQIFLLPDFERLKSSAWSVSPAPSAQCGTDHH
jgi:hypothetical protein